MKEFRAEKRLCPKLFTIEAIGRSQYIIYIYIYIYTYIVIYPPPKHQGYLSNLDHAMCRNLMVTTSSNMHDKLCLQHAEDDVQTEPQ